MPSGNAASRIYRVLVNYVSWALGAAIVYIAVVALLEGTVIGAVAVLVAGVVHFATAGVRIQTYYLIARDADKGRRV